jgi:hypothetical protein
MFSRKLTKVLAVAATACAIGGGSYGIITAVASTGSGPATTATTATATSGRFAALSARANARSRPAAGGSTGIVVGVSKSSFTVLTTAGQKVAVKKTSSTKYQKGTSSSSARAVKKGVKVLVLGTTSGTTITASKVVVQPSGGGSTSPTAVEVVPFQRGAQSMSKQVGQIPASYSQVSGKIVSGTAANRATETALAAYPGGVVDRVVRLSNGELEVHNIGVNWPHHIFVSNTFRVVGAD